MDTDPIERIPYSTFSPDERATREISFAVALTDRTGRRSANDVSPASNVLSDRTLDRRHARRTACSTAPGPFTPTGRDEPMYATTGIGSDLMVASRDAIRAMVERLHERIGLSRTEAYALCSVAADLKINEPNWIVSAYLAESLFPDPS